MAKSGSNYVFDTKSDLARHVWWKERLGQEKSAYLRSMEKWLSLGIIDKVPVIDEIYFKLNKKQKTDPHQLFQTINNLKYADREYLAKLGKKGEIKGIDLNNLDKLAKKDKNGKPQPSFPIRQLNGKPII